LSIFACSAPYVKIDMHFEDDGTHYSSLCKIYIKNISIESDDIYALFKDSSKEWNEIFKYISEEILPEEFERERKNLKIN